MTAGDAVVIDTRVQSGTGPRLQSATFTVGAGGTGLSGQVSRAIGTGQPAPAPARACRGSMSTSST